VGSATPSTLCHNRHAAPGGSLAFRATRPALDTRDTEHESRWSSWRGDETDTAFCFLGTANSVRSVEWADGSAPARLIPVCHQPEVPDVGAITLRNLDGHGTPSEQRLLADVERVG
jgi:hypothetical protein